MLTNLSFILNIFRESIAQAVGQLVANKLRSFLSLLGIMIGIFCIIGVKSAVNSLEENIRNGLEKLGNDVIYVDYRPWGEDPEQNYWKYMRRPRINYSDYEAVKKVKTAEISTFSVFIGGKTLKYQSNSVDRAFGIGATYEYNRIFKVNIEKGRYFSPNEYQHGANVVILGYKVAEGLFGIIDPVGKEITYGGRKMQVIGVIEKGGKSILDPLPFDECFMIPYPLAKKLINTRSRIWGTSLNIKAANGVSLERLKDDATGVMRAHRHLKPREENNFALNEIAVVAKLFDSVFSTLNIAGVVIGGFALFVGMFSVANIMFVAVKERTNIIGIKKAIGAKKYMILLEFLIESIILCIVGSIFGLLLIFGTAKLLSNFMESMDISLSWSNMLWGVGTAIIVGIISGVIPALQAANMDPVEAIRN